MLIEMLENILPLKNLGPSEIEGPGLKLFSLMVNPCLWPRIISRFPTPDVMQRVSAISYRAGVANQSIAIYRDRSIFKRLAVDRGWFYAYVKVCRTTISTQRIFLSKVN